MALSVATNTSAATAHRYLKTNDMEASRSLAKLSSGSRIVRASDDAASLAVGTKLKAVHEEKPDQRVFMRGDKAVDYGKMMEVMGVVIDSGFRQLGLLGEQAQQLGKGAGGTVSPAPAPAPAPRGQPQQQPTPRR